MVSLCNKTLYEKLRKMFDPPDGNIKLIGTTFHCMQKLKLDRKHSGNETGKEV
jgi:hypothetical protein